MLIKSPLPFVRGATRVKSIRVEYDVDWESLAICTHWFIDYACDWV
jgi:hypothetical protein